MRPHYSIVTGPASEPLTFAQASEHVRIDSTDDQTYVEALIPVAREYVDQVTGRVSITSTWKVVAPSFRALVTGDDTRGEIDWRNPWAIPLLRTPLSSVTHIKYYPPDTETQTTISSADYRVITGTEPGMVQFLESPPNVEDRPDAVEIQFVAGHAASTDMLPQHLHAIKMLVAHLYENRIPASFGSVASEIPMSTRAMLENIKVKGWVS